MKNTILIGFYSSKTSGASLISLNTAIIHQLLQANKKIAYLELSTFPQAHLLSGKQNHHNWGELVNFIHTNEWNLDLLNKIPTNQACDIFHAPELTNWKNITLEHWQEIIALLSTKYDGIYLDINNSCPAEIKNYQLANVDNLMLVSNIDPLSLEATRIFLTSKINKNINLLINQCDSQEIGKIKYLFNKIDLNIQAYLPQENKFVWHNIYEGFPVAFQKKSKLRKEIQGLVNKLIELYF